MWAVDAFEAMLRCQQRSFCGCHAMDRVEAVNLRTCPYIIGISTRQDLAMRLI